MSAGRSGTAGRFRISTVTPCYNEAETVEEFYNRIKQGDRAALRYEFVFLFIDNLPADGTVGRIWKLAKRDRHIRLIVSTRHFGHICSPYYGIPQVGGAATMYRAADLRDPPKMIPEFICGWEEGFTIVLTTKPKVDSPPFYRCSTNSTIERWMRD